MDPDSPDAHVYRLRAGPQYALVFLAGVLTLGAVVIGSLPWLLPVLDRRVRPGAPAPVVVLVAAVALVFLLLALALVHTARAVRLVLTPDGVRYHQAGYRISSRWDNVVRIQPVGFTEALVLRESGLEPGGWLRGLARFNREDYLIPLPSAGGRGTRSSARTYVGMPRTCSNWSTDRPESGIGLTRGSS